MIRFRLNGREVSVEPSGKRLLDVLRVDLGLTGTKEGCGNGNCGTCTVLFDGMPVNACLVLALEAPGHEVLTIEGVARSLHPELNVVTTALPIVLRSMRPQWMRWDFWRDRAVDLSGMLDSISPLAGPRS